MTGIDTTFLVAWEMPEHPRHGDCRTCMTGFSETGERLALTPSVLAEFLHVATDPRRFLVPLTMERALDRAFFWRNADEVSVLPTEDATFRLFEEWMKLYKLGRKRILDTMLAATLHDGGATGLLTLNKADFTIFGVFDFPLN